MRKITLDELNEDIALLVLFAGLPPEKRKRLLLFAQELESGVQQPPLPGVADAVLNGFWQFYDAHAAELNHAVRADLISIHLPSFCRAWREAGGNVLEEELKEYLPFSARRFLDCRQVHSALSGKSLRCWRFRKPADESHFTLKG